MVMVPAGDSTSRVLAPADSDGVQPRRKRRHDVLVDAVADVEDLLGGSARRLDDCAKKPASGFSTPQRSDEPTKSTCARRKSSWTGVHVPGCPEPQAALAQRCEARQRVVVEIPVREHERGDALRFPALVRGRLVDERLPDVEDDDRQRHPATVSRSASEVTLSRRGSPSTTLTRPPAASTSPAQSVASAPPAWARRSTSAANA